MYRQKTWSAKKMYLFEEYLGLIKVVVALCMVRNSVGSNCYVADEIITSRAGVRLRVGNTDAEGRMVRISQLYYLIINKSRNLRPWWMCSATPRRRP